MGQSTCGLTSHSGHIILNKHWTLPNRSNADVHRHGRCGFGALIGGKWVYLGWFGDRVERRPVGGEREGGARGGMAQIGREGRPGESSPGSSQINRITPSTKAHGLPLHLP